MRAVESNAAAAYWNRWTDLDVPFAGRGSSSVPAHWRTFGRRHSPITGNTSGAATPGAAPLNYALGLATAEAHLACLAAGLDVGLGIFHSDDPYRDSMAFDVVEPARAEVEGWLLDTLRARTFRPIEFLETSRGVIRLGRTLAAELSTGIERWRPSSLSPGGSPTC